MSIQEISQTLKQALGKQVEIIEEGQHRYPIFTPFLMEDGDHFNIVLMGKEGGQQWVLTDEGDTLMHLSYWMDYDVLKKGSRQQIIERVLGQFGVENRDGVLRLDMEYNELGNAIFTFLQTLTRITDITYLSREQVRSTFKEDFREYMREAIPEGLTFDYHHPEYDPQRKYTVDVRINHRETPLFVFAIGNNRHCLDVTINLHTYNTWGIPYQSVAIFQDQKDIARDVLARFSDVADKQFSSLYSSRTQITDYWKKSHLT